MTAEKLNTKLQDLIDINYNYTVQYPVVYITD